MKESLRSSRCNKTLYRDVFRDNHTRHLSHHRVATILYTYPHRPCSCMQSPPRHDSCVATTTPRELLPTLQSKFNVSRSPLAGRIAKVSKKKSEMQAFDS